MNRPYSGRNIYTMRHTLLFVFIVVAISLNAQVKVNLDSFNRKGPAAIEVQNNHVQITWPGSESNINRVVLDLDNSRPLFKSFQVKSAAIFKTVSRDLDPVFILTVG